MTASVDEVALTLPAVSVAFAVKLCNPSVSVEVVKLSIEALPLPDGTSHTLEIVRHPGGAAVVAIDAQGRLCLLRQYRHAAGGWLWELPAGKREAGEDPLHTAQRELEEEAGVRAAAWQPLGNAFTTPGFCDEVIHFYLARTLTEGTPRPESHEWLEHHKNRAINAIKSA